MLPGMAPQTPATIVLEVEIPEIEHFNKFFITEKLGQMQQILHLIEDDEEEYKLWRGNEAKI